MSSNNVNDMTVGSPMRAIFRFAVPLIYNPQNEMFAERKTK